MAEDIIGGGDGGGDEYRNEWSEFNELTLSVMANRNRYDKCKKSMANTSDALADVFCKEKTYYKDRILAMTSGLFDERCENDEINRAHQEYLKSCIEYLKWNDITDMVEGDTRTEESRDDDVLQARRELQRKIQDASVPSQQSPSQQSPPQQSPSTNTILSFANKMCIRKKTIDDFIVMKPTVGNTDDEINARLPKVRDYHNIIMKRTSNGDRDYTD